VCFELGSSQSEGGEKRFSSQEGLVYPSGSLSFATTAIDTPWLSKSSLIRGGSNNVT